MCRVIGKPGATREDEEDDLNEALPLSCVCVLVDKTDERAGTEFRFDGESRSTSTGSQTPDGRIKTTSTRSASVITKGKNVC